MLKATLRQPCPQTQPGCPAPSEAVPDPCVCRMDQGDTEGDTGCWQERGSRGGQRCHHLRDASKTVAQEGRRGPLGGKASGNHWREPGGLNRDVLVPTLDASSLALVAEPATPQKCPDSDPEMPPAAASPTADPSQEWKVVKIQRVLINPASEPRKAGLSRSASLSEKELKEAKAQSRRIAAQLTTAPGPSSKGVLLFNRRKQRVDGLAGAGHGGGLPLSPAPRPRQAAMEEGEGQGMKPQPRTPGKELQGNPSPCREPPAEDQQVPLSVYLKENMASAATNGVQEQAAGGMESGAGGLGDVGAPAGPSTAALPRPQSPEEGKNGEVPGEVPSAPAGTTTGTASPASQEQNGARGRQYYEVHLTLAKPKPVKNRTARPFGTQASPTSSQPMEGPPATELPPPPTYAETLSSPPPLTRVRSPPAYSALYPPREQKMLPGPPLGYGGSGPNPLPKTGILEESAARRANKKSMFTFVEKPKLGPNPDLLDLVQSADSRKKQKEQGEPGPEDEPFALGAEAANFVPNSTARGGQHLPPADDAPAWSSCLKSPTIQPKPKPQPSHNLTEARGKGAELFARRQSRMEKFIIEAPSQPDLLRSPSPTMSLPPSWKYDTNACLSPMVSRHPSKSPSRPSKTPPASLYGGNLIENEVSQKELEISKHQPYQLQSSLFILSPSKGPARSMPREMPPPRPSLPDAYPYPQQTSCPTSPLPPSPVWHPTAMPGTGPTTSSPFPGASGALPLTHSSRASPGAPTEVLLASPCRLLPPRAKGGFQAPRPSYSTRNAGIEPQDLSSFASTRRRRAASLEEWQSCGVPVPGDEGCARGKRAGEGRASWVMLSPMLLVQPCLCPSPAPAALPTERRLSLPASPRLLRRHPGSLDGWASPASVPELDEGPPMSPPWSERSLSPLRQDADPRASRQMQARLARNIINAARRKSSSPKAVGMESSRPFTPIPTGPPSLPQSPRAARSEGSRAPAPQAASSVLGSLGSPSPTHKSPLRSPRADGPQFCASPGMSRAAWAEGRRLLLPPGASPCPISGLSPSPRSPLASPVVGGRSPAKRCTSRSPTDSDVSLDSEDSGAKSPGIHSFNLCPRGWTGSLRLKPGGLPSGAPCTS